MAIYIRNFRSRLLLGSLITLVIASGCNNSVTNDEVSKENRGQLVYQKYCIACHGEDGKLKSGNAADLSVSKISEDAIRKVILYGNNKGMGPYKSIIKDEEEIKALIQHVKTLRNN